MAVAEKHSPPLIKQTRLKFRLQKRFVLDGEFQKRMTPLQVQFHADIVPVVIYCFGAEKPKSFGSFHFLITAKEKQSSQIPVISMRLAGR
jgi:hypothetical protein